MKDGGDALHAANIGQSTMAAGVGVSASTSAAMDGFPLDSVGAASAGQNEGKGHAMTQEQVNHMRVTRQLSFINQDLRFSIKAPKLRIPAVRVWPKDPKEHYKFKYSWLPQPLLHKAASLVYQNRTQLERKEEEAAPTKAHSPARRQTMRRSAGAGSAGGSGKSMLRVAQSKGAGSPGAAAGRTGGATFTAAKIEAFSVDDGNDDYGDEDDALRAHQYPGAPTSYTKAKGSVGHARAFT